CPLFCERSCSVCTGHLVVRQIVRHKSAHRRGGTAFVQRICLYLALNHLDLCITPGILDILALGGDIWDDEDDQHRDHQQYEQHFNQCETFVISLRFPSHQFFYHI